MRKVKVNLPKTKKARVSLPKAKDGMNFSMPVASHPAYKGSVLAPGVFTPSDNGSLEEIKVNKVVKPTEREHATLEAEKGETVVTSLQKGGIPELYTVGGKRHYKGGTPLNLPPDSFVFSRDNSMKIKDPDILAQFGKTLKKKGKGKKGYTPADISKQYQLNDYHQILLDPDSTRMERETAELMIQNYNFKLGGLAMIQESMKGFPDGIPGIAMPYLAMSGIDPKELSAIPGQEEQLPQMRYGGVSRTNNAKEPKGGSMSWTKFPSLYPSMRAGGRYLPMTQQGMTTPPGSPSTLDDPMSKLMQGEWGETTGIWGREMSGQGMMALADAGIAGMWGIADVFGNQGARQKLEEQMKLKTLGDSVHVAATEQDRGKHTATQGYFDPDNMVATQFHGQNVIDTVKYGGQGYGGKFGGSVIPRKAKVSLPQYQGGGQTTEQTSERSTGYQNIPEDAVKWDVTKDGYDETQLQPGDYVKKEDGKWYKVTGHTTKDYGYEDSRLGDLQPAYGHLENTIMGNEDLQNAIYANYQKHIESGQLSESEKERLLSIDKDQVINNFLQGQKQVYAINSSGALYEKDADGKIIYEDGKPVMKSEKDLKVWESTDSEEYKKVMHDLGFTDDELFTGLNTAMFQAAYRGLEDASRDEQFSESLANFNITPVGLQDSHGMHTYEGKAISPVDKFFGNTTAGQAVLPKELDQDLTTEEVEWTEEEQQPEEVKHLLGVQAATPAKWWTEDIVNTLGAAGDFFRVKKYDPWMPMPAVRTATPTFADETRQLAANAELANISTQGAGVFSGPQAFNARAAQIQGKAAANVANIMSGVHNQNVATANQFELANTNILNQASDKRAMLSKKLYDEQTIANQQFDNEKNLARANLRNSWIQGWSNKGSTQATNQLYEQYNVDPTTGYLTFEGGRPVKPKTSNQQSVMDKAAEYKRMNPGWDDSAYVQLAKADAGVPGGSPGGSFGVNPAAFAYPGGVPEGYAG